VESEEISADLHQYIIIIIIIIIIEGNNT
jgi:hypothetical protein